MGNNNFSAFKLLALRDWINTHFSQCIILIPDSVYRLSMRIDHGLAETEALDAAKRMADNFIDQYRQLFTTNTNCRFSILRSQDIVCSSDYRRYLDQITTLFQKDDMFHQAIFRFVDSFLTRKHRPLPKTLQQDDLVVLSSQFVLEELSVAAYLVQHGYPVSVYPGTIEIFHEIAAGLHPGLPEPLLGLINIGIYFKKRSIARDLAA